MGKRRGAGRITMRFSFREILGEVGAIVTPYIYNIKFYRLPKDITKVISRVRDRLVEISNGLLSYKCKLLLYYVIIRSMTKHKNYYGI